MGKLEGQVYAVVFDKDELETVSFLIKKSNTVKMRDIRNEIESLGDEVGRLIFEPTSYTNKQIIKLKMNYRGRLEWLLKGKE